MEVNMSAQKNPAQFIREDVFGCKTQKAFADLLGYPQNTISRFEKGTRRLTIEAQNRIRAAAKKRRIKWDNNWFFEVPREAEPRSCAA
jgi:transcriptional regulator with XRE-family HTH domain